MRIASFPSLERLRWATIAIAMLWYAETAGQENSELQLKGVDVYGTEEFGAMLLQDEYAEELDQLVSAIASQEASRIQEIKAEIVEGLEPHGHFAFLNVSAIVYYPPDSGVYITIDAVEAKDRSRRIPFRPAPNGEFEDPEGLIAAWNSYADEVTALAMAGTLEYGDCPVLHCLASFDQAPLAPYLRIFNEGVARNEDVLYAMAAEDGLTDHRATAIFLLAHTKDAGRLLPLLSTAIYDHDFMVRNNAMRVMIAMAEKDPDLTYPLGDLIAALDFPMVTDRNKALYAIASLTESPAFKERIRDEAIPTLLRLLELNQPNNHKPAYDILKSVSGQSFGDRDYSRWKDWFTRTQATLLLTDRRPLSGTEDRCSAKRHSSSRSRLPACSVRARLCRQGGVARGEHEKACEGDREVNDH